MISGQDGIDLEYLDSMSGGDPVMRSTLLDMLVEELPREMALLVRAAQHGDIQAVFQASHSMKSTLSYTGHAGAIQMNEKIESSSREGIWGIREQEALHALQAIMTDLVDSLVNLPR